MKRIFTARLSRAAIIVALLFTAAYTSTYAASGTMALMTTETVRPALPFEFGEYDFNLYNRTNGWVLNGFYTKENDVWSKNWLTYKLAPGKSIRMRWNSASDKGACVVPYKATWDGYDKAEMWTVDWCKGIKSVILKDEGASYEYK